MMGFIPFPKGISPKVSISSATGIWTHDNVVVQYVSPYATQTPSWSILINITNIKGFIYVDFYPYLEKEFIVSLFSRKPQWEDNLIFPS